MPILKGLRARNGGNFRVEFFVFHPLPFYPLFRTFRFRRDVPDLTNDGSAGEIGGYKTARAEIVKMILDRAPPGDVVGGHPALSAAINVLIDSWESLAADRKNNAERLFYGYPREKALLHDPLDPLLASLDPEFRRFTAGRSMRDVEHAAALKITDPYGNTLI
jgi:hypothetical protein